MSCPLLCSGLKFPLLQSPLLQRSPAHFLRFSLWTIRALFESSDGCLDGSQDDSAFVFSLMLKRLDTYS